MENYEINKAKIELINEITNKWHEEPDDSLFEVWLEERVKEIEGEKDYEVSYCFTFGIDHNTKDGIYMADKYIKVTVHKLTDKNSYFMEARLLFIERFSKIKMKASDAWAFQYPEKEFKKFKAFPLLTEAAHIIQNKS